jgi:hypothetical protein
MNRTTSHPNKDTAPADANRRRFLMQAGTGVGALTAGLFLNAKVSESAGPQSARRAGTVERRPAALGPVTRCVLAGWHPPRRIRVNAV